MSKQNDTSSYKEYEKNVTSYKKYEKPGIEKDTLASKKFDMSNLVAEVPTKLHIISPAGSGKVSAKPAAKGENPLQAKDGEVM